MSSNKKELKVFIIRELLQNKDLTDIEALLLSKLIDLSNLRSRLIPDDDFVCRPTNKYLGEILNLKGFTVQKYLSKLYYKGYIQFNTDFEFYENLYHKKPFEFTESRTREIIVVNPAEYENIFEVKHKYLMNFKHKEAILYSYLDGVRRIPCYKIKKSTIAAAMGIYNYQNIKQRITKYPYFDHDDAHHVYLKQ